MNQDSNFPLIIVIIKLLKKNNKFYYKILGYIIK